MHANATLQTSDPSSSSILFIYLFKQLLDPIESTVDASLYSYDSDYFYNMTVHH